MINDEPDSYRWLSIILLGVMVLVSVAMVHLDKPKPLLITLAVSTCSICIVLSLIGLAVNPFSGMLMISKTPLERVLER
jgi:CHASE2 domain-containing sensor protein